jgi:hypothetical protein
MTLVTYLEEEFGDILVLRSGRQGGIRLGEVQELQGLSARGSWLLYEDKNYDLPFCVTAIPDLLRAIHLNFANAVMRGDIEKTVLWDQAIGW